MNGTQPSQTIEIDRARKLVIVNLSGFFTPEIAHAATMETRRAIQSLGEDIGKHVTLYDATDLITLPSETVELIQMGFANPVYRSLWARKVAFVTSSMLLRMQIDRIRESRPDMRVFDDREAATDWLTEA